MNSAVIDEMVMAWLFLIVMVPIIAVSKLVFGMADLVTILFAVSGFLVFWEIYSFAATRVKTGGNDA